MPRRSTSWLPLAATPLLLLACSQAAPLAEPTASSSVDEELVTTIPPGDLGGSLGSVDIRYPWEKVCAPSSPTSYPKRYFVERWPELEGDCTSFAATGGTWTFLGNTLVSVPEAQLAWCLYEWTSTSPFPDGAALAKTALPDANGNPLIQAVCAAKEKGTPRKLETKVERDYNAEMMGGCPKCALVIGNAILVPNVGNYTPGDPLRIGLASGGSDVVEFSVKSTDGPAIQMGVTGDAGVPAALKDPRQAVGVGDMSDAGAP